MNSESSAVCKEHLTDEYSETGQVEEVAVSSRVEEDVIFRLAKGIAQEQREEDAEECWGKDSPLLHTALDREGVRG